MTIAVLGASGVIGRALVPALAEQEEVVAVSRHAEHTGDSRVRSEQADVTFRIESGSVDRKSVV